jgi:glycosyltransferase involved in cell wall biosynthesis
MIEPTLSIVLATIGRKSLPDALASCRGLGPRDELIVAIDNPQARIGEAMLDVPFHLDSLVIGTVPGGPHRDWGGAARNWGMSHSRGDWLLFLDDDDAYVPGAITAIRRALTDAPLVPHIFRMCYPDENRFLWRERKVEIGNVSTQMICVPNDKDRLGKWGKEHHNDYLFLVDTLAHYVGGPVWCEEIIQYVWPTEGKDGTSDF